MHERSSVSSPYSDLLLYIPLLICGGLYLFGVVTSPKSHYLFDITGFLLAVFPVFYFLIQFKSGKELDFFEVFQPEIEPLSKHALLVDRMTHFSRFFASYYHIFALLTFTILLATELEAFNNQSFLIVYFTLTFIGSFSARSISICSIIWFLLFIWGRALILTPILSRHGLVPPIPTFDLQILIPKTLAGVGFGALTLIIYGVEVYERRLEHRRLIQKEKDDLLQSAKEYRLLSSRRSSSYEWEDSEELLIMDAAKAIGQSIFATLELAKRAFDAHTCILLWLSPNKDLLKIKELISDSDYIQDAPIRPDRGIIGGIYRRREPLVITDVPSSRNGLTYYSQNESVKSFLGVPVMENGNFYGVLCVDRVHEIPFNDEDVLALQHCAETILRNATTERLFLSIEKSKSELSQLFEASSKLNNTLTREEVYRVAVESIDKILPYDLCAITSYDAVANLHTVVFVDDRLGLNYNWKEISFPSNTRLVSMVVKNLHPLPYGGVLRTKPAYIFSNDYPIEQIESLLVLPLTSHEEAIGTLIVGSKKPSLFNKDRREILTFVAAQIAIPLHNASLYEQMERMATTDGLTGLPNHRTFQQKMDETIARAARKNEVFCLLITDIDHFKMVNDTYGHPVGDQVLRRLSKVFIDNLREIDIPARYGGEEFAVILDSTNVEGAKTIANRLREALKEEVFTTPQGEFSKTMSIGLACWPEDGREKQELIDHADQALYYSKEHGRNRVTCYKDLDALPE